MLHRTFEKVDEKVDGTLGTIEWEQDGIRDHALFVRDSAQPVMSLSPLQTTILVELGHDMEGAVLAIPGYPGIAQPEFESDEMK